LYDTSRRGTAYRDYQDYGEVLRSRSCDAQVYFLVEQEQGWRMGL
jgi:hypothetical protein